MKTKKLPNRNDVREQIKELACKDYESYTELVHHGQWKRARHLDLLCHALEDVERGDTTRLIISMPPRHGKSMTVTQTFPSWFIGKNPYRRAIEVSYGDELARKFGRENRRKIEEFGRGLFDLTVSRENSSGTNWGLTGFPGGMISAGVGGSITGEGADLLVIDDPIKNRQEAESTTYRERLWSEWQDTLMSRLHPGGRVVIIMTRWHEDDLVGRLIAHDTEKQWRVINLPALADEGEPDILGRAPGEPLWPEIGFDAKWAEEVKSKVGTRTWESLYQGRPRPLDGGLFKASTFRYFRTVEDCYQLLTPDGPKIYEKNKCRVFQTCDVAGSAKSSADYFVLGTFALTPGGDLLVLDILREHLEGPDQPALMRRKFHEWSPVLVGVEGVSMGLTLYQQIVRDGLPVLKLKPDADKYTRAIPAAARYESGAFYHCEGAPWLRDLESELLAFPNGAHDDQVDVISYAAFLQAWGYLNTSQGGGTEVLVLG